MRPLIAGNWKMHGLELALNEIARVADAAARTPGVDLLVCPPTTLLAAAARTAQGRMGIGGQDCHPEVSGAHTGEVSSEMLKDAGASAVIVGHSERRRDNGETNGLVAKKALAARRAGLLAIVCVGETQAQRDGGAALAFCGEQIVGSVPPEMTAASLAIGYEPLWAIGSGKVPSPAEIAEMHARLRSCLVDRLGAEGSKVRILYGGSVNPEDARMILALPEVGGALVGGASLKAESLIAIAASAER